MLDKDFDVIVFEETATTFPNHPDQIPELNESVIRESFVNGNIIIYTVVSEELKMDKNSISDEDNKAMIDVYQRERQTVWVNLKEMSSYLHPEDKLLNVHIPIRVSENTTNTLAKSDKFVEKSSKFNQNTMLICEAIIKQLKMLRNIPEKLTYEYIQLYKKQGKGENSMYKEIKPPRKFI